MNNYRLLKAEVIKIVGDAKTYWFNLVFGNLNIFFLFLGLFYGFGKTSHNSENTFQLLIGLMIWYYGVHAIDLIALIIQEEVAEGTLEQVFMTKTSFVMVLLNRIIAQIIFDTIKGIFVFTLCIITFKIPFKFIASVNWIWTILVFLITLAGLYGIGYMVAGLSIVYKRVSSIAGACSNLLLFFTGLIIDVNKLPKLFIWVSKILPLNWGMNVLEDLVNNDFSMLYVVQSINFFMLVISSVLWIVLGVTVFKIFKRRACREGVLNQY